MRFVLAIVSLVLALLTIGLGIAQRTIFAQPDNITASVSTESSAPITIIDGSTFNANPRQQTLTIDGSPVIFAAYGRTIDIEGWAGGASANRITYDAATKKLKNTFTPGEPSVPKAEGSDLWVLDYSSTNILRTTVNVPDDHSFLIMSDGTQPAPPDISIVWPVDNSTPWAMPLVMAGTALLLIGLALLFWAIIHVRKARGPRRKSQKMPKLPRQPRYKPSRKPKAITALPKGRRSAFTAVLPVAIASSLVLTGCGAFGAQTPGAEPSSESIQPSASSEADNEESAADAPAVTEKQAQRIVAKAAEVIKEADETRDAELARTRLAGPALDLRLANYKMRKADKKIEPLLEIPAGPVALTLPQQSESWPRTVFAAIKPDDTTVPAVALILRQETARDQYLIHYAITLQPGAVIPKVPLPEAGTSQLAPDVPLLALPPADVAGAYADIMVKDTKSSYFESFVAEGDTLRDVIGLAAQKKAKKKIPSTAKLDFVMKPGAESPVALATADLGALVAVSLDEIQTVKVVEQGAAVNAPDQVKALLGKKSSTKGLTDTYNHQILFYVPRVGSDEKIVLLGYSQGIVSATEYKKKK